MPSLTISFDLSNGGGLADLDTFLSGRSYIVAFAPTQTDVQVFEAIGSAPKNFANVARFYNHIASFTAEQRKSWPAGIRGLTVGDAPAAGGGGGGKGKAAKGGKGGKKDAAVPAPKAKAAPKPPVDDDSDDDLFGSDDEDFDGAAKAAAAAKEKAEKAAKKKKKEKPVQRTQCIIEVKPWEAGQDLSIIEGKIREIVIEGLTWGEEFRAVDVAFGIQKLIVQCVVVDDLVAMDDVIEPIEKLEDLVQSVDLATMNRL